MLQDHVGNDTRSNSNFKAALGNLNVLGAMVSPGLYYERGLLHPFIDYDLPPPWLNTLADPMDDEGNVHISPDPGLDYDINWDYINSHLA